MLATIRSGLAAFYPAQLVDELLAAYVEAKENYYRSGLRLSAVEGGRFSEAALRLLQHRTAGVFTPVGQKLDTDKVIATLGQYPRGSHPDSVRLHIPRVVRVVYDIRNNRDAAHLGDNIDPNLQDATLVVSALDWILAEFVRLHHNVSADDAQRIVEGLVTRRAPAVQDFNGFLKVLRRDLKASEVVLLILYERGKSGSSYDEINRWVRPSMRANLRRTLDRLTHEFAYVHFDGTRYLITGTGRGEVERRHLHQVID